jgi:hypothetical protein
MDFIIIDLDIYFNNYLCAQSMGKDLIYFSPVAAGTGSSGKSESL